MKLRRLLLVYLSALSFLFASVLVSVVVTEFKAEEIARDTRKINLAGRQRMLSQRIIYLAENLSNMKVADIGDVRAELRTAIEQLEAAVGLFEDTHDALSASVEPDSVEGDLYFEGDASRQSLDVRVKEYARLARLIVDDPTDDAALAGLVAIERAGLLNDLDAVVSNLETESVDRIALLRTIERASLAIALVIIVVEILFVFLPGHRMIQRTLDRLRRKNAELKRAYAASEALRKEQSEFTYAVSHDLKSPATSIGLLLSELISEEGERLSDDGRDLLDHGMKLVKRIGVQVEDILNYACATTEETDLEEVDIGACVADVLSVMGPDIAKKRATVDVSADAQILGSRRQITMLLQNLIENAMKYQPANAQVHIDITAKNLPGGVEIVVADNGIGIDPANHEKIFKLFERLHLRNEYAGTGLGLATCKRVVDNHRGDISVDSEVGRGARFTVFLQGPVSERANAQSELAA